MVKAKVKKSRYIFLFLRIAVVLCGIIWAVLWVSKGQRWDNLKDIFLRINLWVFTGTLCIVFVGHIIVGSRWWFLLRTQSISIGIWVAVRLYFLGWFYNNFMPSSVGGDLIRAWYVTKHTHKRFEAVLSVFMDRAIGLLSTLIIAAFFYLLFLPGRDLNITASDEGGFLASVAKHWRIPFFIVASAAVIFCSLFLHKWGRQMLSGAWSYFRMLSIKAVRKLKDAIIIYCSNPLTILTAFVLTVIMQITTITGFWFLGLNMGITASVKYYYVFFTLTWVLGAVPVSIGGAVVMESLLAYLFVRFAGVRPEAALALALCQRIVWMITSLPGAVIHLIGAHLPKDFFIDYDRSVN